MLTSLFASCSATPSHQPLEAGVVAAAIRGLSMLPAVAGPVAAQPADVSASGNIGALSIHLSRNKVTKVTPDELVAIMSAKASTQKAVQAQHQVNAKTKVVTDQAKGIKTTFQLYSATFVDEKPAHWTAEQTLGVKGAIGEDVNAFVGQLQDGGLVINGRTCQVSQERSEQAHRRAVVMAPHRLREQTDEAARALGVKVDHFKHINLSGEPQMVPLQGEMPMTGKVVMPTPISTKEEQTIIARVSADLILRRPRSDRSQAA